MNCQQYKQLYGHKDSRRQYQGKVNRDAGKQFETLIDEACFYYQSISRAVIEKTPEPMKVIKSMGEGRFLACFEKKAQPDYKGTLQGGKSIEFDAKHSTTGQMEQSRVKKEQTESLEFYHRMGASCFVVIGFNMNSFFRIPWEDWRDMKSLFGRRYVRPEELEQYRIVLGRTGVLLFLD